MIQAWRGPGDALRYHPSAPRRYGKCDYRKERNMAGRLKSARLGRQGIAYLPAPSYSLFVRHNSILSCPNSCCTPQLSSTLICKQSSYAHRYCLILRDGHWRNQGMGNTETGKGDTKTEKKKMKSETYRGIDLVRRGEQRVLPLPPSDPFLSLFAFAPLIHSFSDLY